MTSLELGDGYGPTNIRPMVDAAHGDRKNLLENELHAMVCDTHTLPTAGTQQRITSFRLWW